MRKFSLKRLYFCLTVCLTGWVGLHDVHAQTIDDLGIVWSKTYGNGMISNIKPNSDGTYTACGYPWTNPTGSNRLQGLLIVFDESGNELRRATATIPQWYINTRTTTNANARFSIAFKTNDGGYLAFGTLYNVDAPLNEKQVNFATGNYHDSPNLLNGAWIVKFNSNLQVVSNTLVRGKRIDVGWVTNKNTYLVGGYDAQKGENQNYNDRTKNTTLLREYDLNGNLINDFRNDYSEILAIHKYTDGSFVATTTNRIIRINAALTSINAVQLNTTTMLPGVTSSYIKSLSPNQAGGVFISTDIRNSAIPLTNYQSGSGLYKLNSNNQHVYHKNNIPSDTVFSAPLLLHGSTTKYVGTAIIQSVSGSNVRVTDKKIYELTDNGTKYSYRTGVSYPNSTALNTVGQVDGFFSCGSSSGGLASIAKLSTCAKFILNVGTTTLIDVESGKQIAERTINAYGHANGTVSYNWTITDITPGGAAANIPAPISGATADISAKTFTLNSGKSVATIQYIITAKNIVNNTSVCQQTQTITVNVYPVLNPGTVGSDQTICSDKVPAPFTSSAAASGGNGTIAYQWQSRTYDGLAWSSWVAAAGANNQATYSPGALTQRTQYRRCATNTFTAYSDTIDIQIAAAMSAGAIGDAQTICYNTTPSQLTSTTEPNGGTGTNTYIWEQSATGTSGWANVSGGSGATSVSYTPPNLTTTTHYRRIRSNDCGSDTSNVITITVYDKLAQTAIATQTICYNTSPEELSSATLGGAGGYTYQWEQSTDSSTGWVTVTSGSGATSASYTPPALTQTTWYRRKVSDSKCGYTYSGNTVKITVRNPSLYNYPDIRVRVCPDASTSINMSKYIDTLDLNGVPQWQSLSNVPITSGGVISTNNLSTSSQVHTFTYSVSNPCIPEGVVRKVYLEVLKAGSMRPLRDTITICSDYAEAVNINQIFGVDAGFDNNVWSYESWTTGDVNKHVTISKSSMYYGAVIMNGKAIYDDNAIAKIPSTNNKRVVFTYKPKTGSCFGGKSYTVVIILTGS